MNCDELANTAAGPDLWMLTIAAIACMATGAVFALVARERIAGTATALLLSVVVATALIVLSPSVLSSTSPCTEPPASVKVSQTSVIDGLAPGVAPAPIAGVVVNTGVAAVLVTSVDVEISSITPGRDAVAGACDSSDYVLTDHRMPVGTTLAAGQSARFDGASIGFSDKPTSQDACQNAIVTLSYTARVEP